MLKILLALLATTCTLACAAQSCGGDLRGAQSIESDHYIIAYRTQPAKIAVGKHFSVDIAGCPKGGAPAPDSVAVDAYMPEHGHGMNYKATVTLVRNDKIALNPAVTSGAHYRATGLMFHMPGRWDLTFELRAAGATERLTRSIVVE